MASDLEMAGEYVDALATLFSELEKQAWDMYDRSDEPDGMLQHMFDTKVEPTFEKKLAEVRARVAAATHPNPLMAKLLALRLDYLEAEYCEFGALAQDRMDNRKKVLLARRAIPLYSRLVENESLVSTFTSFAGVVYSLGVVHRHCGNADEAMAAMKRASELDPTGKIGQKARKDLHSMMMAPPTPDASASGGLIAALWQAIRQR